jgi:hypothetical protein
MDGRNEELLFIDLSRFRKEVNGGMVIDMRKRSHLLFWIAAVFILSAAPSACTPSVVSYAKVTPWKPGSMVIFGSMTRNYSGNHGILNIYADSYGFPNSLTYTPISGEEENEPTATLWLVIVSRPVTFTSFRVKPGQTIEFEGYRIEILRIGKSDQGIYFVEVEVTEP